MRMLTDKILVLTDNQNSRMITVLKRLITNLFCDYYFKPHLWSYASLPLVMSILFF